jgi:hypothetical protein
MLAVNEVHIVADDPEVADILRDRILARAAVRGVGDDPILSDDKVVAISTVDGVGATTLIYRSPCDITVGVV